MTLRPPAKIPGWKWWIVVLMLLATVINYIDRQVLSSVSTFVKRDFGLNEEGYGNLEAVFGYSYAIFLVVAGFMADRRNLRWLYPIALLVWSVAGFATGFVETLFQLQVCRAILGAGEAFNWPVAVGVIRRIIPREAQGFANGVFNSGMTFGAVVTPILVLTMVGEHGERWRHLFILVGAAGSIWVVFWLLGTRGERATELSPPAQVAADAPPAIPFAAVFSSRLFWITCAVGVAVNMSWHFYRVWLPRHLLVDLHFTDRQLQYLLIAFFLTADIGSIGIGFLAGRLARRFSVERSRKIVLFIGAGLCLLATPILFQPDRTLMVPLYCLVGAGIMGVFAMFYALVQDIAPDHTSKCLGLIGALAWLINSRLHPWVGRFADTHAPAIGKFAPMILVAGVLPLIAACIALSWPEKKAGAET
ncbi:MAG: hypothetical protein RLZZ15_4156 [Verrucomicrobiota bacterium]|jgi:ACS family hexuronate transporter-like MFS transporter